MRIALWLHVLGTVVWVGGMFFAHVALRPAVQLLEPAQRLPLLSAALGTFLKWVGAAVVSILVSGFMMIFASGGFTQFGAHVHLMTALGLVMMVVYGFIVSVPYPRLRAGVEAGQWPAAGAAMTQVRRLVGINLILGLVTITIAILGHGVV
ncbi:MAG TPA: CopD family protein [Casimicrobiaceae bacterium]|nr:CopD family protein [Casimicrobiaceae bacterium]